MSKEAIIQRILSDAEAEAEAILAAAQAEADGALKTANEQAEAYKAETAQEIREKAKAISDGKEAAARLDSAKVLLGEKRRVIDVIYERALEGLLNLKEKDCVALTGSLLKAYAEEGDEIIFSRSYPYAETAALLPVIKEKKLRISSERAKIDGGFLLSGTVSDRDLSYRALLDRDREEHQTELAAALFKNR